VNSRYVKGRRLEYRSMKLLESAGYQCFRMAGSHGEFDLVAIGAADIVLVQAKGTNWPGAAEMEALRAFRCPGNCRKLIHRWRDRQRLPDVREL
jgi:predicted RNA binding protein YcfA (HicA-like mRNA interferase family)